MTNRELHAQNEAAVRSLNLGDDAAMEILLVTARRLAQSGIVYKPYAPIESGAHRIIPASQDGTQTTGA